ncbi:MAG: sugar phosphate nucleotidyltransferase [Anaerovoracaceae bacterium]
MKEPVLIIMAAGMGSRYGGLKQFDPITSEDEVIMDFSLYDAMLAGFRRVVFVIREEMEEAFAERVLPRAGKHLDVAFAHQRLDDLPAGYGVPKGREKPWGTAHAIMSCRDLIDGPFVVINADDYYGPGAFHLIYDYLSRAREDNTYNFAMVSFALRNTVTENGSVARGICDVSKNGYLRHIVERTKIMRVDGQICYSEDDGANWTPLDEDTPVSMNFWGYSAGMMYELVDRFPAFLDQALRENPLKAEYMIPTVTDQLLREGRASVTVLHSRDRWYGVTYREDKPVVSAALQSLKDKGLYPDKLWK